MEPDGAGGWHLSEPSSKVDALMQILEDNPDEPVVVFSQFKQLIRITNQRLADKGIPFVTLTGDTSQPDRASAVELFQSGRARVFTGTIAAGGVGITLTSASTVVFLDRSWSPATNQQAEDRLHRIGQKNAVQVVDVMARNTVDLGRHQRLEQKWGWIRTLLGDK
jgi:SNF2 family DNA or RNA helicase